MPLAHLILGVLDRVPELHGYGIREITAAGSWSFPISNPPIYPALRQLEADGMVSSRSEVVQGRHRRFYAITDAGRHELRRWLGDPDALPVGRGAWRDPMLFRLRLLDSGGIEGARRWIQDGIDYFEEYLHQLEDLKILEPLARRTGVKADAGKYMLLAAELAREVARARVRGYRRILEEIERELSAEPAAGRSD